MYVYLAVRGRLRNQNRRRSVLRTIYRAKEISKEISNCHVRRGRSAVEMHLTRNSMPSAFSIYKFQKLDTLSHTAFSTLSI